jgi:hypothetical protein
MIRKTLLNIFTMLAVVAFAWPIEAVSAAQPPVIATPVHWLTVTSPNGGEVMSVGSVQRITWNSSANINRVTIGYKACAICFSWIATNIPNTGYYDWTVSVGNTTNTQFRILVIGYQTGSAVVVDTSDSNFTVNQLPTPTRTPTKTRTLTPTRTPTLTKTPTITKTSTSTITPVDTSTFTVTATDTEAPTSTNTFTPTSTATDTETPTSTNTFTPTFTATDTETPLPTATYTLTATSTDTETPTSTNTHTATSTVTSTSLPTDTPTFTPTFTRTPTNTPSPSCSNLVVSSSSISGIDFNVNVVNNNVVAAAFLTAADIVWPAHPGMSFDSAGFNGITYEDTDSSTSPVLTTAPSIQLDGAGSTGTFRARFGGVIDMTGVFSVNLTFNFPDFGDCILTGTVDTNLSTATFTPTITRTVTRTRTVTVTRTVTRTTTSTRTPTFTPTPTDTVTIDPSVTESVTWTSTVTRTITPTRTPSRTPTVTATRTSTRTPTVTATRTPTIPTSTSTSTYTPTPTVTLTQTLTRTLTRTRTVTNTPFIPTSTPTRTETPTEISPSPINSWITVNTPNGGEILTPGDIYSITWQSSADIDLVDILIGYRYTCDGCPLDWNLEWSEGLVPNSGSYDWTVQVDDVANKEFIVLLQGERLNGSGGYDVVAMDESDSPFTVEETIFPTFTPTITSTPTTWVVITSPNGGEVLSYGYPYAITWQSSPDIELVNIMVGSRYTCAGCGAVWNLEWGIEQVPNNGSYEWDVIVDDPANKEFLVLVQGERFTGSGYNLVAQDVSDNPFIVELSDIPTVTVTQSPTGTSSPVPTVTYTFTPTPSNFVSFSIDSSGSLFGYSVNTAGDVNGDGFDDVLIGARDYWNDQVYEGGAFLYLGAASILDADSDWSVESNQASSGMGQSVDSAGDVNGDGFDDILVGAMQYSLGEQSVGAAFAYYGSANGPGTTADWIGQGNQAGGSYGWSVSGAGDVNNDGYDDVIVGARYHDNGQTNEGRAYLYMGSATGLDSSPAWIGEIDEPNAGFGYTVNRAGDVNNDGYDDVLITSYNYVFNQINGGKAYLFMGGSSGLNPVASWIGESGFAMDGYGYDASGAGDVNEDGYADILIGAPASDNNAMEGRAYLYLGSVAGPGLEPAWVAQDGTVSSSFGSSLSSAGDFNNDGYDDFVVGDENHQTVFMYLGSADGPGTIADQSYEDGSSGFAVGAAGDVNNDGYDDFLAGAPTWNSFDGRALLFFGEPINIPGPILFTNTPVNTQTSTSTQTPTLTVTHTRTITRTPTTTKTLTATPSPSCSSIFIDRVRFNGDNFEARVTNDNQAVAYLTDATLSWSPSPLIGKYFDNAQFGIIYNDPAEDIVDSPVNITSAVPDLPLSGNGTQVSWIADFSNSTFNGAWSVSLTFNIPDWGDCTVTGDIINFTATPTRTRTPTHTPTFTETPADTVTPTLTPDISTPTDTGN